MVEHISVREAKRRFSEMLSLSKGGKRFVIERRGVPVAALVSVKEAEAEDEEGFSGKPGGLLAVLGMLEGHDDFFQYVEVAYQARSVDFGREVQL